MLACYSLPTLLLVCVFFDTCKGQSIEPPTPAFAPTTFVVVLGWLTSVIAGHTKRVTVNAIVLIGYCVGEDVILRNIMIGL